MTDPELRAFAVQRMIFVADFAPPDSDPRGVGGVRLLLLPLWPAEPHDERPVPLDAWEFISATATLGIDWSSTLIEMERLTFLREMQPSNCVHLGRPHDWIVEPRPFAEAAAVAARFATPMQFGYRKGDGTEEARTGTVLGMKRTKTAPLLYLRDDAREGAIRSFHCDHIRQLRSKADGRLPRWDSTLAAYVPAGEGADAHA